MDERAPSPELEWQVRRALALHRLAGSLRTRSRAGDAGSHVFGSYAATLERQARRLEADIVVADARARRQ